MSFGVLSLLPPLTAILLAIKTKKPIPSLFLGVILGATMLGGWNPILGFKNTFTNFIVPSISDSFNSTMLTMLALTGGFISLLEASGGLNALVSKLKKIVKSRKSAQSVSFLGGILTFFSQESGTILLGPIVQPITDKFKVAREKLAFLLDSTSSSIPSLLPFTAWGLFMIGILQKSLRNGSFRFFIQALPFRFYTIMMLVVAALVAGFDLEFGPLREAQERAEGGKVIREGAEPLWEKEDTESLTPLSKFTTTSFWNFILPLFTLVVITVSIIAKTGDGLVGILLGWGAATIVLVFLLMAQGARFEKILDNWGEGVSSMTNVILVLILSWAIGRVTRSMGITDFLSNTLSPGLPVVLIPVIIFVVGGLISFFTGTSWGTWGTLGPIVVPLVNQLGAPLVPSIAAIFCGGMFGDHSSPISDTSVQASTGSKSNHMDHINTQLPITIVMSIVAAIGFLMSGLVGSWALPISLVIMLVSTLVLDRIENWEWMPQVEE